MRDVPVLLRREEYVSNMVPRGRLVAIKVVPTKHRREESVIDMEQGKNAATKDVPTLQSREGYASDTVRRRCNSKLSRSRVR